MPNGGIVTPEIRDAERLQGFAADWTLAAQGNAVGRGARWKLVGNAVSVPVAEWVGHRLQARGEYCAADDKELRPGSTWPTAAWGETGRAYESDRSEWPVRATYQHLDAFLEYEAAALSERATRGFLARARATTSLRFPDGFLDAVAKHLASMEAKSMAA
jgi:DNA (cytosine-5)-methyltransferase 1